MKRIIKGIALITIAGTMMGNESCEQKPEAKPRELRRRVQMGQVKAPNIQLPQGGTFDFQYVANAQMYDILTKTQSFSTATIDPSLHYDTAGLNDDEAENFNQCASPSEQQMDGMGKLMAKSVIDQTAGCMIDMPQGIVAGNIIDFALTSGGGVSLTMTGIPFLTGGSFDFKKYELAVDMRVMHPLQAGGIAPGDRKVIVTTSQQSYGKDWGASVGLSFGNFQLGPSYYYKTPLRKVVDEGLTMAVEDLKDRWNKTEPWYAMVLRNCDKYIYINAGNASDVGLMKGDIVRIQNVDYRWEGKVCDSTLMASMDYVGGPVAYARVETVGDNMAAAVVLDNDPNFPYDGDQIIKPGARVYMEKMFLPPTPPKKK